MFLPGKTNFHYLMDFQKETNYDHNEILTACREAAMRVTILEEYTNVKLAEDYYTSLIKIDEAIVFIHSKANLKNHNVHKFNALIDTFCRDASVKKPYVQIRDMKDIEGKIPFSNLQEQRKSFMKNQDEMIGYIPLNEPFWMKVFINHAIKILQPKIIYSPAKDYPDALNRANKVLKGQPPTTQHINNHDHGQKINFSNIIFKPEWQYNNPSNDFQFKIGCIPKLLLHISIHNFTDDEEEVEQIITLLDRVMAENQLSNIQWIISDITELPDHTNLRIQKNYARGIRRIDKKYRNTKAKTIIIGATRRNKIAGKVLSVVLNQGVTFVRSREDAFDVINQSKGKPSSASLSEQSVRVSSADLEEISNACGSLLWDESDQFHGTEVNKNNPLVHIAETIELIRSDLKELRNNEKKQAENRLKESEKHRKHLSDMMQDIEKAKEDLQKSEESQRILLDNIPTQIWYLTDENTYGAVNKAHAEFLGEKPDEITGKKMVDFLPEKVVYQNRISAKKVFKTAERIHAERWVENARGEVRLLSVNQTPGINAKGKVEYVVCAAEDITERRMAENQVRQLSRAVEQSPVSIVITNLEGNIEYVNPKFIEVTGYSFDEAMGQNPRILKSGHQPESLYKQLWRDITRGKTWQGEFHNKKKNGEFYWETASISPIIDEKGQTTHFLAVKEDITQRKITEENLHQAKEKAEEGEKRLQQMFYELQVAEEETRAANEELIATTDALRENNLALEKEKEKAKESEEKLRLVTENAFDGIYLMENKRYIYVNDRFCKITGYTAEELTSSEFDYKQLLTPRGKKMVEERYQKRIKGENLSSQYEMQIKTKDGKVKDVELGTVSLGAANDLRIIGLMRDITSQKQAEEQARQKELLENKIAVARESLTFKQNFLANMSHEIRTPLTGILGMIEILHESGLNDKQYEYIQIIQQSGESLKCIVNDVLDFSKIEAGKLTLNKSAFALSSLIRRGENLFNALCKKPVNVYHEMGTDIPGWIIADEKRIFQIISNFISNAAKFTEKGNVTLSAELLGKEEQNKKMTIKVSVTDTGIGIEEEKLKQLFQPFSQIDHTDTRQFDGTGLGLVICRELAKLHGGTVGVSSKPGEGSTFWFTFVTRAAEPAEIPGTNSKQSSVRPIRKLKILLVEDRVVNQKVVSLLLRSMGHEIMIAAHGKQAIEKYKPGAFDLILMDIQMPVMDGITATHTLKKQFTALPPIVGLSANAFEGDREKYMDRGLDEYITKPIEKERFYIVLERLGLQ
ncbi:MAG: PAS domain S-box protein [Bacteroidales bacterium]